MYIRRVQIERYGGLRDLDWALPEGLTVVYGPNEAGKSSMLGLIRGVLFGFPARDGAEVAMTGSWSGALTLANDEGDLRVERKEAPLNAGRSKTAAGGTVRVTLTGGLVGGEALLRERLGGMGAEPYRSVFAFSLSELQELRTLQSEELSAFLYSAGLGLDGRVILNAERRLAQELEQLYRPRGKNQPLSAAVRELDRMDAELRESRARQERYDELASGLQRLDEAIALDSERLSVLRAELAWLEAAQMALPHRRQGIALQRELAVLPVRSAFPPDALARFERLDGERRRMLVEHERLAAADAEHKRRLAPFPAEEPALALAAELEPLLEGLAGYEQDRRALTELELEAAQREAELASLLRQSGVGWSAAQLPGLPPTMPLRERIRVQRETLEAAKAELAAARAAAAACDRERAELGARTQRLARELAQTLPALGLDAVAAPQLRGRLAALSRSPLAAELPTLRRLVRQREQLRRERELLTGPARPMRGAPAADWATGADAAAPSASAGSASMGATGIVTASSGASASSMPGPAASGGTRAPGEVAAEAFAGEGALAGSVGAEPLDAAARATSGDAGARASSAVAGSAGAVAPSAAASAATAPRARRRTGAAAATAATAGGHSAAPAMLRLAALLLLAAGVAVVALAPSSARGMALAAGAALAAAAGALAFAANRLARATASPAAAANAAAPAVAGLERLLRDTDASLAERLAAVAALPELAAAGVLLAPQTLGEDALDRLERQAQLWQEAADEAERRFRAWEAAVTEEESAAARHAHEQERLDRAEQHSATAKEAWAIWLQTLQWPADLSPDAARELLHLLEQARERLEAVQSMTAKREALSARLQAFEEQLAALLGPEAGHDPSAALRAWDRERREAEQRRTNRLQLEREQADLAERLETLRLEEEQLVQAIRQLWSEAEAEDENSFRLHIAQQTKREALEQECRRLNSLIEATIGPGQEQLAKLDTWIDANAPLEADAASRRALAEQLEQTLDGRKDRRGRLAGELDQLEVGMAHADKLQQREDGLTAFDTYAGEWAARTLAAALLRRTKAIYERERQPALLRAASEYFGEVTGGRFRRIVMPVGEQRLAAERTTGELIDSSRLSRGTAEQLYLAMRFALADELERIHHTVLPMIMDDVFVNFDRERLGRTIGLLGKLAQRRQLLYFTCHPHAMEAFRSAGLLFHERHLLDA